MKEDHLHTLINSLTKTEKSYFKKIKSSFGSKDSILMSIFDGLQSNEEYDEKELIEKIGFKGTNNSFSVKKHALYNGIIDSLSLSRSNHKDALWQINRLIAHGIILKDKSLFKNAKQSFHKAYKLADENEFFYKKIEINQQMIEIFRKTQALTDFAALDELEDLRMEILHTGKQITNNEEYYILADKLHRKSELLRHSSNKEIIDEIDKLYENDILSSEDKALSETALVCYHYIFYLKYYNLPNEGEKALYHLERIISIQETLKRFPIRSCFVQMGNFVRLAVANDKFEDATKMLNRMGAIYKGTKDSFIQIFHCVHLDHFHVHKKSKEDYNVFHEIMAEEWDEMLADVPFNMEVMDLKHAQFRYEFLRGNFKKAFSISNFIDQQHTLHSFKNGKLSEKLLKTICSYELKDFDLMASEIRSIKHLLKSTMFPLDAELKVFEMLKSLLKNNTKEEEIEIFNKYLSHPAKTEETKSSFVINGLKLDLWVQTKCKKSEFSELFFQ